MVSSVCICQTMVFAQSWESGERQVTLIELYTSEGCSSCPPAEAYFNQLKNRARLWKDYVPVVFHVDYWDYLGWKDIYARPEHALRQRHYVAQGGVNSVYTPAVLSNGYAWRWWRVNSEVSVSENIVGNLKLSINDGEVDAFFNAKQTLPASFSLNVALLGMNINSEIHSGENEGKTAEHNFVVLCHAQHSSDNLHWKFTFNCNSKLSLSERSLVAWITPVGRLKPIQAVGGTYKSVNY